MANKIHELLPILYKELHQAAEDYFRIHQNNFHTLQPTAVVHEVFLRMSHYSPDQNFSTKHEFYIAAAQCMRQFLIEYHRRRTAEKRGGEMVRVQIEMNQVQDRTPDFIDIFALHDALNLLETSDPQKAELVKLKFFCGLTLAEVAEILGISIATADRWWAYSKAFLALKMGN